MIVQLTKDELQALADYHRQQEREEQAALNLWSGSEDARRLHQVRAEYFEALAEIEAS
jgi:hypothetical protein